jgi:hypothetical protein
MTSEVYFSVLPREPGEPADQATRRGVIFLEARADQKSGVVMAEIPPEVMANLYRAGRLAGHGMLAEIQRRLRRPRPVVWGGRTVR